MPYQSVVISSGHSLKVRGASGVLDEVNEARKVVDKVAEKLRARGVIVKTFHDDTSTSQSQNLNTIVNYHNKQSRQLDVSVHFNAYQATSKPMGTEVLYVTQASLADQMSAAIASVGFLDRGHKKRTDLAFLNGTHEPAILLEVCFVDSSHDADLYKKKFDAICENIATVLGGASAGTQPPPVEPPTTTPPPDDDVLLHVEGKVSWFGGPDDKGVSASEGLAFIYKIMDAPHLFLPYQPDGTTGLARRLNPHVHFVACRWDYDDTPKPSLLKHVALVRAPSTGIELTAFPADWGPHSDTGRVADISKGLMDDLGIETDDEVEVIYPYTED